MIATSSPWPALTWRSTQLWQAFSVPPSNQRASGHCQSSTEVKGVNQSKPRATSPQKPAGSSIERCQSARYSARLATCGRPPTARMNASLGGKTRLSLRALLISGVMGAG